MSLNLVRCQKCGTIVLTAGTLEERLLAEREELQSEIRSLANSNSRKLKAEKQLKIQRAGEINRLLRQMRHQIHEEQSILEEFFSKYLIKELERFGYTKEDFNKFNELAKQDVERTIQTAKQELKRIYGEADKILGSNEWRNASGYYDPTPKKAIDNLKKG